MLIRGVAALSLNGKENGEENPKEENKEEEKEQKNIIFPVSEEVLLPIRGEARAARDTTPTPREIGVPDMESYTRAQIELGPRIIRWQRTLSKPTMLVVGLMSGTSCDGIDLVLARITGQGGHAEIEELKFAVYPFPEELRQRVQTLFDPALARIENVTELDFAMGAVFGIAINRFLKDIGKKPAEIDLIATAGQTIWHAPQKKMISYLGEEVETAATLAIGQTAVIREMTGIPVIGDLRVGDVAVGGHGAPLISYYDWSVLRTADRGRCIQNIGGIANVSYVPPSARLEDVFGFDTGPGNMIIDGLMEEKSGGKEKNDFNGRTAAEGSVIPSLLEKWMADDYFRTGWPKTTGREKFGIPQFVRPILEGNTAIAFTDLVATATMFTAESIARAYRDFILPRPVDEIIVGGGGAENPTLMSMLQKCLKNYGIFGPLMRHEHIFVNGEPVNSKSKEAMAIALIGHDAALGCLTNTRATGGRPTVLGKLIT